jgi:hypothetical protein
MTLQHADFSYPLATVVQPRRALADRLRDAQAIFFVSLGLFATMMWIAVLGWFLYRAVLMIGFG